MSRPKVTPPEFMQLPLPMGDKRRSVKASANHEAAAPTSNRRASKWYGPTTGPNSAIIYDLTNLRDRCRNATRNNGWAKGIIDKLTLNIVGTGIKPLSKADDVTFARQIQDLWTLWTDYSDAAHVLDLYGQQSQIVRCWLEAGECFARLRPRLPEDELPVPLQIEVLEPEMCPINWNITASNGNLVKAGIEFDKIGNRVAYYFYASRPGATEDWDSGDIRRVPAESVIHVYDPLRAGQIRGVPHLTQALIRLTELDTFDDATLKRVQIGNLFAGFLKRPSGESTGTVNPFSGVTDYGTSDDGHPLAALEPGIMQELDPGEEMQFNDPPDAGSNYAAFMMEQLRSACASAGCPYELLTGNMGGMNDRVMRVVLHEFRRGIQARQHAIVAYQFCRPVWNAFLDRVFLAGTLPIPPEFLTNREPWARVKWMPQGWPYLHPVQDVDAAQKAILAGFTSRSAVVSEQGEDAAVIDDENSIDNARAKSKGLTYASGTGEPPKPAPSPFQNTPAPEQDEDPAEDDEEKNPDDEEPGGDPNAA